MKLEKDCVGPSSSRVVGAYRKIDVSLEDQRLDISASHQHTGIRAEGCVAENSTVIVIATPSGRPELLEERKRSCENFFSRIPHHLLACISDIKSLEPSQPI